MGMYDGVEKNEHKDRIRTVGKYTYGVDNIAIYYWADGNYLKDGTEIDECFLDIGKFCSISGHQLIYLGGNHHHEYVSQYPFGKIHQNIFNKHQGIGQPYTKGGVKIGDGTWIGTATTIHSGVTIGKGAVIASNSVVTKDVEDFEIVGGNPAKHIKYRFDEETRKQLLELDWWNMSDAHINELTPLLCSENIEELIKRGNELKHNTGPKSDEWLGTNFTL